MKFLPKDKVKSGREKAKGLISGFIFVLFSLFTVHYSLFTPSALAKVSVGPINFQNAISDNNSYNKESFDFQSVNSIINSLNIFILGCSTEKGNCPRELQAGAVQGLGNMIASLYSSPPASGVMYATDILQNIGIAKPAYAQAGFGFGALGPIQDLWRIFRNLTYVIFIIVFVITGLAIMLRARLSPQVVLTIQNALPRVVIALLLVTFSYAIAGLMIDLSYVLLNFAVYFFFANGLISDPDGILNAHLSGNFLGVIGGIFGGGLAAFGPLASALGSIGVFQAITTIVGAIVGSVLIPVPFVGALAGGLFGAVASGGIGASIIMFFIAIALIYTLVRIFLILLISYISIIFLVIFGPLQIMLDALPIQMRTSGTASWLRALAANVFIFPITAILIIIATIFTNRQDTQNFWFPPLMLAPVGQAAQALIGLGMLLFLAQILNQIKSAIGTPAFEREMEPLAQRAGDAVTWPGRAGGEEALRRRAESRAPHSSFWSTLYTWGRAARRWR